MFLKNSFFTHFPPSSFSQNSLLQTTYLPAPACIISSSLFLCQSSASFLRSAPIFRHSARHYFCRSYPAHQSNAFSPRPQPIKTRILFLKRPDHFEQAVFREDLFVFHVLATVTFGTPSPTRLLKITMHGLTDHSCQQREKREDIGPAQIEPK